MSELLWHGYLNSRNAARMTEMTKLTAEQKAALKPLMARESKAYRALMNDPAVIANPTFTHTPELMAEWDAACAAERAMRESFDLAA
jgi:hypothetical protein